MNYISHYNWEVYKMIGKDATKTRRLKGFTKFIFIVYFLCDALSLRALVADNQ